MSKSVLYMSMSLDGFITGPHDGPGNGLGDGGHRLHEWLGAPVSERPHFDPPGLSGQVFAEAMATGAVVVGRKTFDYANHWHGDHHRVPIFVPTRGTPPQPGKRPRARRQGTIRMTLHDVKRFASGVVLLTYHPAGS